MWKWWCLSGSGDMVFLGESEEWEEALERAEDACKDADGVRWLFTDVDAARFVPVLVDNLGYGPYPEGWQYPYGGEDAD